MTEFQELAEEFRHVFDDLPELERELAGRDGVVGLRSIVGEEAAPAAGGEAELEALQADGRRGIRKLREGLDDELTRAEARGLEAIIHLDGRPAIFVQEGGFFPPPKRWRVLEDHRPAIEEALGRVGRIEVEGHSSLDWIGTGFLAGPGVVMTNEHVVREFARQQDGRWRFRPQSRAPGAPGEMRARLDLREELDPAAPLEFEIGGILGVHDDLDLALLEVADQGSRGAALPPPLPVAAASPGSLAGRKVYVVGYPNWDGRRNDPEVMRRVFAGVFNVKRLAPGEIRSADPAAPAIVHDCSTLGGNSGSPVIDLETHKVVGLHFFGRYLEGNRAIPLWRLRGDPLLRGADLRWE